MKKVFALLMMLAMVTVCGSAMAEIVITGDDLPAGKEKLGTGWSWNGKILELKPIDGSAYTVKNWNADGRIEIDFQNKNMAEYTVDLTLENVVLESDSNVIYIASVGAFYGAQNGNLNLTLKNTSLVSNGNSAFIMQTSSINMGKLNVNIKGENASLKGDYGAYIHNNNGLVTLTLSGTMTIVGNTKAVFVFGNYDDEEMYIDGAATPGIHAEWAKNVDGSSPTQFKDSPFSGMSDDVYGEINSKKFLRLYKPEAPAVPADVPQTGSLPQTGDSSSLALWLCLLAFVGAGMTAMRKRAA